MRKRISKDEYYMEIAKKVAERSTCLKRNYGCVIVKNDEIIATGYNGSPRGECNCCDKYDECPRLGKPNNHGDYSDCPAVHIASGLGGDKVVVYDEAAYQQLQEKYNKPEEGEQA